MPDKSGNYKILGLRLSNLQGLVFEQSVLKAYER